MGEVAKEKRTLTDHIESFIAMVTTNPITETFVKSADYINEAVPDHVLYEMQRERDVRRLGLYRVEEALPDLSREELAGFVKFLLTESKERQKLVEQKLEKLAMACKSNSENEELLNSLRKLNRMSVVCGYGCWFCGEKPAAFLR
jgi:hypothetical protein